jgi:RHS repeat-associated protein
MLYLKVGEFLSDDTLLADERTNLDGSGHVVTDEVLWALTDQQGTVNDLAKLDTTTGATSIVDHIVRDSFGKVLSESDPSQGTLIGYTGRPTDKLTDIEFHDERVKIAGSNDWLSEDPDGFTAGQANLSDYCGNSPTNATDPSGLAADDGTGLPTGWSKFEGIYRELLAWGQKDRAEDLQNAWFLAQASSHMSALYPLASELVTHWLGATGQDYTMTAADTTELQGTKEVQDAMTSIMNRFDNEVRAIGLGNRLTPGSSIPVKLTENLPPQTITFSKPSVPGLLTSPTESDMFFAFHRIDKFSATLNGTLTVNANGTASLTGTVTWNLTDKYAFQNLADPGRRPFPGLAVTDSSFYFLQYVGLARGFNTVGSWTTNVASTLASFVVPLPPQPAPGGGGYGGY